MKNILFTVLILMLSACTSSIPSEYTCRDGYPNDCSADEYCDLTNAYTDELGDITGSCVKAMDCTLMVCPEGFTCEKNYCKPIVKTGSADKDTSALPDSSNESGITENDFLTDAGQTDEAAESSTENIVNTDSDMDTCHNSDTKCEGTELWLCSNDAWNKIKDCKDEGKICAKTGTDSACKKDLGDSDITGDSDVFYDFDTADAQDAGEDRDITAVDEDIPSIEEDSAYVDEDLVPADDDTASVDLDTAAPDPDTVDNDIAVVPDEDTVPPCSNFYKGHCYAFINSQNSWGNAKTDCAARNGYLATISDDAENTFVKSIVTNWGSSVWIGFTDASTEGSWLWENGEVANSYGQNTGTGFVSPPWSAGEPSNSSSCDQWGGNCDYENCAEMGSGGMWNDSNCGSAKTYVCESGVPSCGNSKVEIGEGCDDGAMVPGDGCGANCQIESGYFCKGQPSVCKLPCGHSIVLSTSIYDCSYGWENSTVTVRVDGITVLNNITLSVGCGPQSFGFQAGNNQVISVTYTSGGGNVSYHTYEVKNGLGATIITQSGYGDSESGYYPPADGSGAGSCP